MPAHQKISPLCRARIDAWLDSDLELEWKTLLLKWMDEGDIEQIEDAFGKNLSFGTAGIRRKLGPGPNRMNRITVESITQALIQYISTNNQKKMYIAIGYDTREHSHSFAETVAITIIQAGHIPMMLSKAAPTPLLAFAIKQNNYDAGVMITASHNPTEYNGYKIYNSTGSQICHPVDQEICKLIEQLPREHSSINKKDVLQKIQYIDEIENFYFDHMKDSIAFSRTIKRVPLAYTSMEGAGFPIVAKALRFWGFSPICKEKEQIILRRENSNPETIESFKDGIEFMQQNNCALLLANDPDADRIGLVSSEPDNTFHHFSGNEIALLLIDYIGRHLGKKISGMYLAKSIASTPMIDILAKLFDLKLCLVPTGFKYIAKLISELEAEGKKDRFLMGLEESSGFLIGTKPREKDGIFACCLMGCVAEEAWQKGTTLYQQLLSIKRRIGFHFDATISMKISDSKDKQLLLKELKNGIKEIKGIHFDFQEQKNKDDSEQQILEWKIGDQGRCIIRASGTEPKIKCYISIKSDTENEEHFLSIKKELKYRIEQLTQ